VSDAPDLGVVKGELGCRGGVRHVEHQGADLAVVVGGRIGAVERAGLLHGLVPAVVARDELADQGPPAGDALDIARHGLGGTRRSRLRLPVAAGLLVVVVEDVGPEQPAGVEVGVPDHVHHLLDEQVGPKGAAMAVEREPGIAGRVLEERRRGRRQLLGLKGHAVDGAAGRPGVALGWLLRWSMSLRTFTDGASGFF